WPSEVTNFKSIEDGYAEVARNYLGPFIVERADLPPFFVGGVVLESGQLVDSDDTAVLSALGFYRRFAWVVRFCSVFEWTSSECYDLLDRTEARLVEVLGG
ncbi:MAG: hypothetical protein HON08_16325, partial [Gemmatimonadales bacterium]|nr:hypothetical protein [Gemmatimonadales bacterium]